MFIKRFIIFVTQHHDWKSYTGRPCGKKLRTSENNRLSKVFAEKRSRWGNNGESSPLELFKTNSEGSFRHVGPMDLPLQRRGVISIVIAILLIQAELPPREHPALSHWQDLNREETEAWTGKLLLSDVFEMKNCRCLLPCFHYQDSSSWFSAAVSVPRSVWSTWAEPSWSAPPNSPHRGPSPHTAIHKSHFIVNSVFFTVDSMKVNTGKSHQECFNLHCETWRN